MKTHVSIFKLPPIFLLVFFLTSWVHLACKKTDKEENITETTGFSMTSTALGTDSLLPAMYTCDGDGNTLPLSWAGAPSSTAFYALVMYHMGPDSVHWYWVVYNIPANISGLAENATDIGILGNNSVNGNTEYAPPCSQGPGRKDYVITLYALSSKAEPGVAPANVSRKVLLESIRNITLDSTNLNFWYERPGKK